jgi:hypothetical protein
VPLWARAAVRAETTDGFMPAPPPAPALPGLQRIDEEQQHERDQQHHHGHRGRAGVVVLLELADDDERRDLGHHGHVARDEDHRAILAHGTRERHRKAREQRRRDGGQNHLAEGLPARCAQARGGLFEFLFHILQHRLHRAHHERQADEDQRHHDARGPKRQHDAQRLQVLPHPAIAREQRRKRDASDGGGQRKRQIDERIDDLLARESVAHQHPSDQQAEHQVHERSDQRGAKGQPVRGQHARRAHGEPELLPAQREGLGHQRHERQQHDRAQIKQRVAQRQAKARQHAPWPTARGARHGCSGPQPGAKFSPCFGRQRGMRSKHVQT